MIVFRFILFILMFGGLAVALYSIMVWAFERFDFKRKIFMAKYKKEKELDDEEGFIHIRGIEKKTLSDRYKTKTPRSEAVKRSIARRKNIKKPTYKSVKKTKKRK